MRAEDVVYALLTGAGPVTAVVSDRIYPVVLPQDVKVGAAAIVYELISAVRQPAIDATSPTHVTQSRVQLNLLAPDLPTTRTLRDAVVAALQFQRGLIAGVTVHSVLHGGESAVSFDPQLGLFHRPVDFLVLHQQ